MYTVMTRTRRADSPVVNSAGRRIGRFMRTHRTKITSTYLAQVCSAADECMSFGKEFNRIARFFANFVEFNYQKGPMRPLAAKSVNGLVFEVPFERSGFRVEAALKICRPLAGRSTVDNLYYEYLVGLFLNRYALRFPCFLHTYGIYLLTDRLVDHLRSVADQATSAPTTPGTLIDLRTYAMNDQLEPIANTFDMPDLGASINPQMIYDSMEDADRFALLTQFFPRSRTLSAEIQSDVVGMAERCPYILYTIYSALQSIGEHRFVHHDLHLSNVLVIRLPPGQYIEYRYAGEDGRMRVFRLDMVVKMIDYGRCMFSAGPGETSMDVFDIVRKFIPLGGMQRAERLKHTYPFRFMLPAETHIDAATTRIAYYTAKSLVGLPSTFQHELKTLVVNLFANENPAGTWRSAGQIAQFLREAVLDRASKQWDNADLFAGSTKVGELEVDETGQKEMRWTGASPASPVVGSSVWTTLGGRGVNRRAHK